MQAVVATRRVAEQKRRGPVLAVRGTAGDERGEVVRKGLAAAERGGPAIGDRRQARVRLAAQGVDDRRQRLGEVTILARAEAMARHVDVAPEAVAPRPERRHPAALGRGEQRRGHRVAVLVEAASDARPVEPCDARGDGHPAPNGAASRGTAAPSSSAATVSAVTGASRMPLR